MLEEAGAEAAGLRGSLFPTKGGLMLIRDATLSRDAANILLQAAAGSLRSPATRRTLVIVAAHYPPLCYVAGLRRLGVPRSTLKRAVLIVDARTEGNEESAGAVPTNNITDCAALRVGSAGELQLVLNERVGHDGTGVMVMIDSADALELGLGCVAEVIVRSALAVGAGVAVAADLDSAAGETELAIDSAYALLEELSDTVADVVPLPDATDYCGRVTLQKVDGQWTRRSAGKHGGREGYFLYNIHDTAVRYYR
jgi:hypothetical protein